MTEPSHQKDVQALNAKEKTNWWKDWMNKQQRRTCKTAWKENQQEK